MVVALDVFVSAETVMEIDTDPEQRAESEVVVDSLPPYFADSSVAHLLPE